MQISLCFLESHLFQTNPAVKSAVKSVKESSRGVKTAYKDLKSKLRDITPPKSQFHSHISSSSSVSSAPQQQFTIGNTYEIGNGGGVAGVAVELGEGRSTILSVASSTTTTTTTMQGLHHRSAPSSPVFSRNSINNTLDNSISVNLPNSTSKKSGSLHTSNSQILNGFKNHQQQQQQNHHHNLSQFNTSNNLSTTNNFSNNYSNYTNNNKNSNANNNSSNNNNNNNVNSMTDNHLNSKRSPTISPSSSLCSSDMNISQELQNHPLFKSPIVDRSVSKIQKQTQNDTTKDLISLDDNSSNNTSFELEDFDPLNQNAKPFPSLITAATVAGATRQSVSVGGGGSSANAKATIKPITVAATSATATPSRDHYHYHPSSFQSNNSGFNFPSTSSLLSTPPPPPPTKSLLAVTAAPTSNTAATTAAIAAPGGTAHNPLYPYFSPQHRHTTPKQKFITTTTQESNNKADDDFELLRKYGLDQFTLTNGNSKTKALNKSDWMVFD